MLFSYGSPSKNEPYEPPTQVYDDPPPRLHLPKDEHTHTHIHPLHVCVHDAHSAAFTHTHVCYQPLLQLHFH